MSKLSKVGSVQNKSDSVFKSFSSSSSSSEEGSASTSGASKRKEMIKKQNKLGLFVSSEISSESSLGSSRFKVRPQQSIEKSVSRIRVRKMEKYGHKSKSPSENFTDSLVILSQQSIENFFSRLEGQNRALKSKLAGKSALGKSSSSRSPVKSRTSPRSSLG